MKKSPPNNVAEFHLVRCTSPGKETRSIVDLIIFDGTTLEPDASHPEMIVCPFELRPNESAIITCVALRYTHNDGHAGGRDDACELEVEGFFNEEMLKTNMEKQNQVVDEQIGRDKHPYHPDFTNRISIPIPEGRFNGLPPDKSSAILYTPLFALLGFNHLQYAGYEHRIFEARSTCFTYNGVSADYQAFLTSDPFHWFLTEHGQHFAEMTSSDILKSPDLEANVTLVSNKMVERVRHFFRDVYFPLYRYTRIPGLKLRWKKKPVKPLARGSFIAVQIQLDFVVVSTCVTNPPVDVFKLF